MAEFRLPSQTVYIENHRLYHHKIPIKMPDIRFHISILIQYHVSLHLMITR